MDSNDLDMVLENAVLMARVLLPVPPFVWTKPIIIDHLQK
jgi:hypothetical protein